MNKPMSLDDYYKANKRAMLKNLRNKAGDINSIEDHLQYLLNKGFICYGSKWTVAGIGSDLYKSK